MSTMRAIRDALVDASRRHSRVSHEAEDLAHDVVVSALRRGSPLEGEAFLRSAYGAVRRHGAFLARTAVRRRAHEARSVDQGLAEVAVVGAGDDEVIERASLSVLSPALRTTLLLLWLGLEKAELRLALGLTDAALRKRFQALRERGPLARPTFRTPGRTRALSQLRRSQIELFPRLQVAFVRDGRDRRILAVGDPDGHGVFFAENAHTRPQRGNYRCVPTPRSDA